VKVPKQLDLSKFYMEKGNHEHKANKDFGCCLCCSQSHVFPNKIRNGFVPDRKSMSTEVTSDKLSSSDKNINEMRHRREIAQKKREAENCATINNWDTLKKEEPKTPGGSSLQAKPSASSMNLGEAERERVQIQQAISKSIKDLKEDTSSKPIQRCGSLTGSSDQWSCLKCTFLNNIIMPICEICNEKRPHHTAEGDHRTAHQDSGRCPIPSLDDDFFKSSPDILEDQSFSKISSSKRQCSSKYRLQSIVHHLGEKAIQGHYVASVSCEEKDGQWCYYDDSYCEEKNDDFVFSKRQQANTYICCYVMLPQPS